MDRRISPYVACWQFFKRNHGDLVDMASELRELWTYYVMIHNYNVNFKQQLSFPGEN